MRAGTKLSAYGLVLVAVLGGGAAMGAAAGPIGVEDGPGHGTRREAEGGSARTEPSDQPTGLLVAEDGYRFVSEDRLVDAGEFAFTILRPDGRPLVEYDDLHTRELHLVIASRDLVNYVHLHPTRDGRGRWSVDVPTLPAGAYRAIADFRPTGARQYTLGVDLIAPGTYEATQPLRPKSTDRVDGFDVTIEGDSGGDELALTVRRDGSIVTTEPYLGAAGHLVALRDGDLAYLHVHPLDRAGSGPVRFAVDIPSAGTYAVFFDFKVGAAVHTARFVLDVTTPGAPHGDAGGH